MIRAAFPEAVPAAVFIGTPGRAQKITVQYINHAARPLAYLKLGSTMTAKELLTRERDALRLLPAGLGPSCIAFGAFDGGWGLLTSAIDGRRLDASFGALPELAACLDRLPATGESAIASHPWVVRLNERSQVDLERILESLASRPWPIVLTHGDLAPWNVLRDAQGRLMLIDWEYASQAGLPYIDLAYYVLQVGSLVRRWAPERTASEAADRLTALAGGRLSAAEAGAFVRLAALDAFAKGRIDGWPDDGWLQRWRSRIWSSSRAGVSA